MPTTEYALQPTLSATAGNLVRWPSLATADDSQEYSPVGQEAAFATIQAVGTNWGGATVTLQGSNDGSNWLDLNDVQGNAVSFSADGYAEIMTAFRHIRPNITGGTSDDVDLFIQFRG